MFCFEQRGHLVFYGEDYEQRQSEYVVEHAKWIQILRESFDEYYYPLQIADSQLDFWLTDLKMMRYLPSLPSKLNDRVNEYDAKDTSCAPLFEGT